MIRNVRAVFAVVMACFLVSGAAGLVYQVVWSRYLALFLGHTSYAVVAVLVAFMGGLALGNALSGRWADRSMKPLALYAWMEIGIGIYAAVFPGYYAICHDGFVGLARSLQSGSTVLLGLKFFFSLLLVLPPAMLMGATFPILTRFVTRSLAELRERVAALYAINSAGAVAGCWIADFWWIPSYGLELTVFAAAGLNLAVGLVSLVVSVRVETGAALASPAPGPATAATAGETFSRGELRLAVLAIGISGFVAMLYEVAWTRMLALALGSSTHAFSLMLMTFISGIAVGAWIIYAWKGLRHTLRAFAWAELALAGTLLISMFFYEYLPFWFVRLAGLLARREEAYPIYSILQAGICFAVMLIPTICLGMTLPLVSRIATTELSRTGRSVGGVFAVNTLGTVLGTVLTGLWLMPALGLARTFAIGIALNAIIGLAALTWNRAGTSRRALIVPVLAGTALLWFVSSRLDPAWQRAFALGLWRVANPPADMETYRAMGKALPTVYHRDGAGATVDVLGWTEGPRRQLSLKVNGKADAGTSVDMITQLLLGHIPMLLRPEATEALVIGLGSGMTCSAVARHPTIERIDAVEISPEVVEGAKFFSAFTDNILANPKLHLSIEDAKSFLQISERKYDLIVSEPSNPWMAGVAAVFSREYYENCARRLRPNGIVAQWMHVYETTDETVELVLRTFLSVFPYTSIWQPAVGDLILVGGTQPLQVDMEATIRRFAEPRVREDLARVELPTVPTVLAREVISQQNAIFILPPDGPVHSDFFPRLEYMAQRGFFLNRGAQQWRRFGEDFTPRSTTWFGAYIRDHPLVTADFKAFGRDYLEHHIPEQAQFRSLLLRWQGDATKPEFPLDLWAAASEGIHAAEFRALRLAPLRDALMREAPSNPEPLRSYASDLMETYRSQRSIFYVPPTKELEAVLERLIETDPNRKRMSRLYLAEIAWDRGDDARCLELGQAALDPDVITGGPVNFGSDPQAPRAVLYRMAETYWRSGRLAEAWSVCQQASAGGYLANARALFPPLEVTYRRIQASVAPISPPSF